MKNVLYTYDSMINAKLFDNEMTENEFLIGLLYIYRDTEYFH